MHNCSAASEDSPDVLASSFSLKLARGIAQTAGGDLRVTGEKLALVLRPPQDLACATRRRR